MKPAAKKRRDMITTRIIFRFVGVYPVKPAIECWIKVLAADIGQTCANPRSASGSML